MNSNYNYLLNLISKNYDKENKDIIKNNLEYISRELKNLSFFLTKYIDIASEQNLSKKQKIDKISNIGFNDKKLTKKQSKQIVKTINFEHIKGGSEEEKNLIKLKSEFENNSADFCLKQLPLLILKFLFTPKYIFLAVSSFFAWLAEIFDFLSFDFDSDGWLDFSQNIDWVYLLLFITASIPFIGQISNFFITIKALIDGKYFLAIINTLTTIISIIFTLHLVDLGLIFKIFYYFDNLSYTSELERLEKCENKGLQYTNNLDQTVEFGKLNQDNKKEDEISVISKDSPKPSKVNELTNKMSALKNTLNSSVKEKIENKTPLNNVLNKANSSSQSIKSVRDKIVSKLNNKLSKNTNLVKNQVSKAKDSVNIGMVKNQVNKAKDSVNIDMVKNQINKSKDSVNIDNRTKSLRTEISKKINDNSNILKEKLTSKINRGIKNIEKNIDSLKNNKEEDSLYTNSDEETDLSNKGVDLEEVSTNMDKDSNKLTKLDKIEFTSDDTEVSKLTHLRDKIENIKENL